VAGLGDHSDTNGSSRLLSDAELDTALAALAVYVEITHPDLATLRERVFSDDTATVTPLDRPTRRRHRVAITTATLASLTVGGIAAAAAGGVLDTQAMTAFAHKATHPWGTDSPSAYTVDQSTARQGITTATPDGGQAAVYTAQGTQDSTGKDADCITVLTTDPGVQPSTKPYRPAAGCNPHVGNGGADIRSGLDGWNWTSTKTGAHYQLMYGHTDPTAVSATFTAPNGDKVTTPIKDGYLLVFIALTDPAQPHDGMSITDAGGHTHVLSRPRAPGPG
jgi:hypothetical protein